MCYGAVMDDVKTFTVKPAASRAEVIERLRAEEGAIRALGATALYLFGSAARDEMTADSDVDLYIDYPKDEGFDYFAYCDIEELSARALGRTVDLTTKYGLHPLLRDGIEAAAQRVF